MTRSKSSPGGSASKPLLGGLVIGFATTPEHEAALIAAGAIEVWVLGRGAQSLEWAIAYCRKRAATLLVNEDLRCFGAIRKDIFATVKNLMARGISLVDIRDRTASAFDLIERGISALQSVAALGSRKTQQRRGRRGGQAKGAASAARRNALIADDIAERICTHPKLNWADRLAIFGKGFSLSGLRRHYLPEAT